MTVYDFAGRIEVRCDSVLIQRLRTVRQDGLGAFILTHDEVGPSLWILINGDVAYLHYFPEPTHPGYQATGMTPDGCPETVFFEQVTGGKAAGFYIIASALVSVEFAYEVASLFFRNPSVPRSVSWLEL